MVLGGASLLQIHIDGHGSGTGANAGKIATADIIADAVDGTKIADDSIDSEHYVDGSIDTAHIGDDQVTEAKIANTEVARLFTTSAKRSALEALESGDKIVDSGLQQSVATTMRIDLPLAYLKSYTRDKSVACAYVIMDDENTLDRRWRRNHRNE